MAADAVARFGRHNDSWINGYSHDFAKQMAALGWIGLTWPTEFGGGGRPAVDRLIIAEELIAAGAPVAAMWFADRQMGPTLIAFGRDDQQAEFLPGILAGDSTWCIGMSEPEAGSDLASLKTSARRDGDDWIINGQKIWTSFAAVADYCYCICRTSSEGPPHAGISEIIVPMSTPGIEVRPITDMTTNRHFCEVFFTDVRVPGVNLVGVEGNAFKQTMRQLEHERGGVDRLVSNHALFELAKRARRHQRPARAPGDRPPRDEVPDRAHPRHPRGAEAGAGRVLGRDEVLLHRARAGRRRVRRPGVRRRGHAVERHHQGHRLRPRLHDHGRHVERHAQHPRRARASASPASPADERRPRRARHQPHPLRPGNDRADDRRRRRRLAAHGGRPPHPRRRRRRDRVQHRSRPRRGRRRRPRRPRRRGLRHPDLADAAPRAAARRPRRALAARRHGPRVLHERRQRVGRLGDPPRPRLPRGVRPARSAGRSSGATRATTASRSARSPSAATATGGPASSRSCPTFPHVPWDDAAALEALIEAEGADSIAAFLFEPITGAAGGCLVPTDEYWRARRPSCAGATTSCSSPTR